MDSDTRTILRLCAARALDKGLDWNIVALAAANRDLPLLLRGVIPDYVGSRRQTKYSPLLPRFLDELEASDAKIDAELEAADKVDARLVTVLDEAYPANLREVNDLPPFLFVRGSVIEPADGRSVAVVGTRNVSDDGLLRARRMARELVDAGVTVTSGLARGVDTAAHTAALDAGGRTIAVIGTGITRCYPSENKGLAERVVANGAVLSQFWPSRPPGRDTFPRRNRVTSGISQGTVVVEASSTSGAKMQARLAAEHGKRVWLLRSLVDTQDWARKMVDEQRATVVASTAEVIDQLVAGAETGGVSALPVTQMTLDFG